MVNKASLSTIELDGKTHQNQVFTARREISDPAETQTDLSPNSHSPTCEFHFSGEANQFSDCTKGRTVYSQGTSVRLNAIM